MSREAETLPSATSYAGGMSIDEAKAKSGVDRIIKLGSNECPFGPSPRAVAAMQEAAAGQNRYPPMVDLELRTALATSLGRGLEPDQIATGNGACDVLSLYAYSHLTPESECIICRPTFPVYELTVRRQGANIVYADLDPDSFAYDIDAVLDAVSDRTEVIYLCSPNNPTGTMLTRSEVDRLLDKLPDYVTLIADEVYFHFVPADQRVDFLGHVIAGCNVLVIHSFSKAFGMAGSRLGYAIGPKPLVQRLAGHRLPFHLNNVTLQGALAALGDTDHVERTVRVVTDGRAYLRQQLTEMGVEQWPSRANFILFRTQFPAESVAEALLRRGVIVRPMAQFYLPHHLRVSVGLAEENEAFAEALKAVLIDLRSV